MFVNVCGIVFIIFKEKVFYWNNFWNAILFILSVN